MTKKRNTKRTLLASILSLTMCVAMLIGSTFAWFTDSATTGVNKIVAGNLDVELDYWNGTEYTSAEGAQIFNQAALWEPGHTEVAYLRIHNAGSLALKYKISVNPDTELVGINMAGEQFKLSDYLVFKAVEGKQITAATDLYTRETAREAAGETLGLSNYTKEDTLMESEEYFYLALVVYMPENIGNVANYKTGTEAPYINLSVNLVATQAEKEVDSFDSKYDAGAKYPFEVNGTTVYLTQQENGLYKNADDETDESSYVVDQASFKALSDFTNAVENGAISDTFVLADDVDMENKTIAPMSSEWVNQFVGTFDGAGHTISNVSIEKRSAGNGLFVNTVGAEIKNITVENITIGKSGSGNMVGAVAGYTYGTTTFENVIVRNSTVAGFGKVAAIIGMAADPAGVTTLKNCVVENVKIVGAYNCAGLIGLAQNEVVLENCETSNVTWTSQASGSPYVDIDATIQNGAIQVKGTYWNYNSGTYLYSAWSDYYNDLYYSDVAIDDTEYKLADGLTHNK